MRTKGFAPSFFDTGGMIPGDIIAFDSSEEGTGRREEDKIATVYRYSVVTESGKAIGVARILTYRHSPEKTKWRPEPIFRETRQSAPQPREQPLSAEEENPPEEFISSPS